VFQGEGFLVPAPAIVDSPETRIALLERCGIAAVFDRADSLDMAILSVGGMSTGSTTYRVGFLTEAERLSLIAAGAVGDLLYNYLGVDGRLIDHPVNARVISAGIDQLRRAPARVLASGGPEKGPVLRAAIRLLAPTTLVTDERTARDLLD
jgi:DNA-binding transcriptional regulator LsrR (DeoR family)